MIVVSLHAVSHLCCCYPGENQICTVHRYIMSPTCAHGRSALFMAAVVVVNQLGEWWLSVVVVVPVG